jgi:hypothetical protein
MSVDRLAVSASGATSLRIADLDAKALAVDGSGAIKMEVAGRTVAQTIEISGAGDYRAEDLASDTAKVAVSGAGRVVVRVAKTARRRSCPAPRTSTTSAIRRSQRRVSGMGRVKQRDAMADPQWTRNFAALDRLRLEQERHGRAFRAVGIHTGQHPDVRHAAIAQECDEHAGHVLRAVERIERTAKAFRVLRLERRRQRKRSSPPPGASGARCALMTAVGSPTAPRNLRMALLAKICAATSRCAARPSPHRGKSRCARRGSASTETSGP